MATASVSQLKARLSGYLDRVKAGEEITVTERGRAIARVVPYTRSGPAPAEFEDMVRAGLIRPAHKRLGAGFWESPRISDPDGSVLRALLEEREEGR